MMDQSYAQPLPTQQPIGGGKLLAYDNVRFVLTMDVIPKEIRDRFCIWVESKTFILSNITRNDVNHLMASFDLKAQLTYADIINDLPRSDAPNYPRAVKEANKIIMWIIDLRAAVILNLLRSTGGADRDRKILASSYGHYTGVGGAPQPEQHEKKGFLRR